MLWYIFSDSTYTTIVGQGQSGFCLQLYPTDPRVVAFEQVQLKAQAQADAQAHYNAFRALGMNVTSTSDPALDGIYDISASSEGSWSGSQAAAAQNVFCGYYHQMTGAKVTMTAQQFTALATAAYTLSAAADDALASAVLNGTDFVAPSNTAAIP